MPRNSEWRVKLDDGTIVQRSHTEYILLKDVKTLLQRNSAILLGLIAMLVFMVFIFIIILSGKGYIGILLKEAIC